MQEASSVAFPYKEAQAKNIFLRDDKKKNYYLLVMQGDKRLDIKAFAKNFNTRSLSFAKESELKEILGLESGMLTPFGVLNDSQKRVKVYIDRDFMEGIIGIHPNDNTATIWLKTKDLLEILKANGSECVVATL